MKRVGESVSSETYRAAAALGADGEDEGNEMERGDGGQNNS